MKQIKTWQECYTRGDAPNIEGRIDCMQAEIDALRQAIERAEKVEPVAWRVSFNKGASWTIYECGVEPHFANSFDVLIEPLYAHPPTAPAQPVTITDAMAYAFHNAIGDGSLGGDEVDEIKRGLAAAFANAAPAQQPPSAPPAQPVVPQEVVNLYDFMVAAFTPMTTQQEEIQKSLNLAKQAMLSAAPAQGLFTDMISRHEGLAEELAAPAQQPLTDEQIKPLWFSIADQDCLAQYRRFARAIEAAHGIKGATE